tara:strand:- start:313 stop:564 length:252 start_codon:yes stop_codon:yes gene_type:complete
VALFTTRPFVLTIAGACSDPSEGLYKYLALLVNTCKAVPLVAFADRGNMFEEVLVSFVIADPPTDFHAAEDPLYPSNSDVVLL